MQVSGLSSASIVSSRNWWSCKLAARALRNQRAERTMGDLLARATAAALPAPGTVWSAASAVPTDAIAMVNATNAILWLMMNTSQASLAERALSSGHESETIARTRLPSVVARVSRER